ncbi:MAG: hypothetical protein EBU90_04415 [Proteobacteria bacterium]|nr:hypothetical protein [Pseudomonadota bacterium]NBP15078.1 hypothetical protein [bacterium]
MVLYNSNFDDSDFQKVQFREFNKTIDDPCAIQQRNQDNDKKLKFITTNHIDLLEAKQAYNFYGMTTKDTLFVPGAPQMESDSSLRLGEQGNILTNCNVRNEYGQLPFPTMPFKGQLFHGDIDVEDNLRNVIETNRKTCNPKDSEYYQRSFYVFGQSVESPDASKSVESHDMGPRGGVSTRFLKFNTKK